MAEGIKGAIVTGFGMIFLFAIILMAKMFSKGIDKVKDIKHLRDDEIAKVDYIVEKLSHIDVSPKVGKVEFIDFHLDPSDESAFYAISPEYLKRLRPKLENLVNQFEQTDSSYGHKYAERRFFIGDKLIFSWQNEVKI